MTDFIILQNLIHHRNGDTDYFFLASQINTNKGIYKWNLKNDIQNLKNH